MPAVRNGLTPLAAAIAFGEFPAALWLGQRDDPAPDSFARGLTASTVAVAAAWAHGRLVRVASSSHGFALLLSSLLGCVGALLAASIGRYLDPILQHSHAIACLSGIVLIAISLEAQGVWVFNRADDMPDTYPEGEGMPLNPINATFILPFFAALLLFRS